MDRAADIEIGEMEKHLGHLGLIAELRLHLGLLEPYQELSIFYSISVTENISIGNIWDYMKND
jgi:biopolymer transport protein ExbB